MDAIWEHVVTCGGLLRKEDVDESKISNQFKVLAESTAVRLLTPNPKAPQEVVEVTTTDNVVAAFQKIVEHRILSAPVYDAANKTYIGFLDTRDLTQYVVFVMEEKEKAQKEAAAAEQKTVSSRAPSLKEIFDAAERMPSRPGAGISVSYLARRNRFVHVRDDDNVLQVVRLMCQADVHRVAVLDKSTGRCSKIISQSTIINWIYDNADKMGNLMAQSVNETQLGSRPVIPVKETDTALEAFRVMAKFNRSGIAVVGADGRLAGNTSGSDLKLFIQNPEENGKSLLVPVLDFLSVIRRLNTKTITPTIVVQGESTLQYVIGKLHATRIHRVFVAEDAKGFKPEAVISLTDVLNHLLRAKDSKEEEEEEDAAAASAAKDDAKGTD